MELALPPVVVWTRGPGVGSDLVAALGVHPVAVSEVRGLTEARRAAAGRSPMLVVLVCPADARGRIADATKLFPGVSILLFSESSERVIANGTRGDPLIHEVPATLPLQELCGHVVEALSRAARRPETPDRSLGPISIEIDRKGLVRKSCDLHGIWFFPGPYPRPGESILPLLQAEDRSLFTRHLKQAEEGALSFFSVRVLDRRGEPHPMHAGMRAVGPDSLLLVFQPLVDGAPIVGLRRGTRDPLTGLIDRWELWRQMEESPSSGPAFVLLAKLDTFASVAATMDFQQVDEVFDRVASAIARVFPWPAAPSRLTGGAFLLLVKEASAIRIKTRATRLIGMVNRIEEGQVSPKPRFGMSIGIAPVIVGDHDLAVRLAETAAREALAAGGNRAVVAGPDTLIHSRVGDLSASIEAESWDVWLQPVVRGSDRLTEFHEALARFGTGASPKTSRPEFFTTGMAEGLLQRFDRMMMLRSFELLKVHPQLRLSVNASRETFSLQGFPQEFLRLLQDADIEADRVVLEISPACLAMPADVVRSRLQRLDEAGVAIALDDFGSGVCSLRHLTDYPLSIVKLDELVTGYVADDPLQRNFVRMVVNLCRARGIRTVAEYTRTSEQMERLAEDGVDLFQGELFGLAKPVTELFAPRTTLPHS